MNLRECSKRETKDMNISVTSNTLFNNRSFISQSNDQRHYRDDDCKQIDGVAEWLALIGPTLGSTLESTTYLLTNRLMQFSNVLIGIMPIELVNDAIASGRQLSKISKWLFLSDSF